MFPADDSNGFFAGTKLTSPNRLNSRADSLYHSLATGYALLALTFRLRNLICRFIFDSFPGTHMTTLTSHSTMTFTLISAFL